MHSLQHSTRARQRGATLIILLFTLLIITLLGVSLIRSATADEHMTGNYRDRDRAFQAAEQALSQCLDAVKAGTYPSAQITPPTVPPAAPVWEDTANWSGTLAFSIANADTDLSSIPACLVEQMGPGFRITSRATGAQASTEVMLQATFVTE
jgi:type IV pilus assembly protein PilX